MIDCEETYRRARAAAEAGRHAAARSLYEELRQSAADLRLQGLALNDLGSLDALAGDEAGARRRFVAALQADPDCGPARSNLALLEGSEPAAGPDPAAGSIPRGVCRKGSGEGVKVALVSFLFNWPSRGGGIVHTVELARFLSKAGYRVQLIHPRYAGWGIGRVDETCPVATEPLPFDEAEWNVEAIQARVRQAVDRFGPDHVIVTDCWNMKPHLADALAGHSFFLRMQALECLCPLNNLRLLSGSGGQWKQCSFHQLASPAECQACLKTNGPTSGGLHRAERALAGVGTPQYQDLLRRSLHEAEAVLVLNPEVAELYRPHCRRVLTVTWGMDPQRFPWPPPTDSDEKRPGVKRLLFAGLVDEPIKGFRVLQEACRRLWQRRQDFELLATGDPPGRTDEFTRLVGWQSQADLPRWYRRADICLVPTIAQDGLSRTSVEAMASGRPVIASRIGGLPFSVTEGKTGLLCEPGDVVDWTEKIERLLDDGDLRQQMGRAGRRAFEERFTWERVIEEQYGPLLSRKVAAAAALQRAGSDELCPAAPAPAAGGPDRRLSGSPPAADSDSPAAERREAVRPLRILLLANFSGVWNNPAGLADVLEELGHTVTRRHEFAVPRADVLLEELGSGRYDCLLFSKGRLGAVALEEILRPGGEGIAQVLRQSDVPAYMWYVDRVVGFDPAREAWMRKVAPLCRVAFVTDGQLLETGWANFRLLRQGILRRTVGDVEIPESERRDVAFLGSVYGERERELAPVRRQFEVDQLTGVYGPDLSRAVRGHRIILGPRFPSTPGYWSDRVYVVLGHGGFFLAPEVPGMREEGIVAGKHYAPLSDDPAADVRYWLGRPAERERIARAGQQLVLSRFTYKQRLEELCRVMAETVS